MSHGHAYLSGLQATIYTQRQGVSNQQTITWIIITFSTYKYMFYSFLAVSKIGLGTWYTYRLFYFFFYTRIVKLQCTLLLIAHPYIPNPPIASEKKRNIKIVIMEQAITKLFTTRWEGLTPRSVLRSDKPQAAANQVSRYHN